MVSKDYPFTSLQLAGQHGQGQGQGQDDQGQDIFRWLESAKFSNAPTAFLYPLYGQGELAQAFCRSAAVNGALYVLRRPVKALLVDKESKDYRGVQTFSGQQIFSKKLVIGPSVVPKNGQEGGLASLVEEEVQSSLSKEAYTNVARFTCITDKSIFEGQTTLLVIFPPESVTESQSTVVRAMQLNSGASVCPDGKYLVQLSTICSDTSEGQQSLQAAVGMLFSRTEEEGSMSPLELDEKVAASNKPKLLWSVSYTQALHTDAKRLARPGIAAFDMPDGALDCEGILTSTQKTFNEFFPDSEFFKKVEPEDEKFAEEMEADFEAEDVETE